MLVILDPFTSIVIAGVLGIIMYLIIKFFRSKISYQGKIQNNASARYYKWISQGLGAIKETKVLGKEKFFLDEFSRSYEEYAIANNSFNMLNQLPRLIVETIIVSGLLILIIIKMKMGYSPTDIVPLLGVLAFAAFRLMPSINRIINLINAIKFQMPFFDELYDEFLKIKKQQLEDYSIFSPKEKEKLNFFSAISIDNVSFNYTNEQKVLNEINFLIPKGKFIGIIGASGAGKTTFVDILLGLLNPTSGTIRVDGIDIQTNIRGLQKNLAYVPQNIYLIDGTIKENIALGIPKKYIDDNLVKLAIEMAELTSLIKVNPLGVETVVGERGVKISGGQRQRIGIARALYQNPEILILDEATSALDNETEKSITNTILKLKGKITIIAIAHRVSTLEKCDFKINFENGNAEIIKENSLCDSLKKY